MIDIGMAQVDQDRARVTLSRVLAALRWARSHGRRTWFPGERRHGPIAWQRGDMRVVIDGQYLRVFRVTDPCPPWLTTPTSIAAVHVTHARNVIDVLAALDILPCTLATGYRYAKAERTTA
jgi:hypothetical protein